MTTSSGSDSGGSGKGGKEHRPYATLDLTAQEISKDGGERGADRSASGEDRPEPPLLDGPDADETPKQDAPRERERPASGVASFSTHMAAGAMGAVLAFLLAYATWGGDGSPDPAAAQIESLRAELAQTDEKLNALSGRLQDLSRDAERSGAAAAEFEQLKQTVSAFEKRVAAIESRPGAAGVSQEAIDNSLDPLAARVAAIESRLAGVAKAQSEVNVSNRATALALALYNLRRAVNEGKPFAVELNAVADMSPVPLDLAALQASPDRGVPSLEQLKADFRKAANATIDTENQPADDSLASELWSKAKSFVRVRRKGDVPGDSTAAILARAEHRLEAGDLAAAIGEAGQLQGPAAQAVSPWLAGAKARLAADQALSKVEAQLLTALAASEKGGG